MYTYVNENNNDRSLAWAQNVHLSSVIHEYIGCHCLGFISKTGINYWVMNFGTGSGFLLQVTNVDELQCIVFLQAAEQDFRRQFEDAVKLVEKRYRSQREEISKLPKAEQRDAVKKLKQDRSRNVALLAEQFKNTVDDHLDQHNVSVFTYL